MRQVSFLTGCIYCEVVSLEGAVKVRCVCEVLLIFLLIRGLKLVCDMAV